MNIFLCLLCGVVCHPGDAATPSTAAGDFRCVVKKTIVDAHRYIQGRRRRVHPVQRYSRVLGMCQPLMQCRWRFRVLQGMAVCVYHQDARYS